MKIQVLDHGYVELVESWGSEERIIEAARMSTNKGFQGWGSEAYWEEPDGGGEAVLKPATVGDEKLLRYLYEHKHHTPFEMAGLTVEVQAPIFVFREWHRHRTQGFNELSARYTPMPNLVYQPTVDRCLMSGKSKQSHATTIADEVKISDWLDRLSRLCEETEATYQDGLSAGVPKEVARLAVTVGRYSRMRATANLRNWLHFLALRMDTAAQWEIRQFANVVGQIVATSFPRTWQLFLEGRS